MADKLIDRKKIRDKKREIKGNKERDRQIGKQMSEKEERVATSWGLGQCTLVVVVVDGL